MTSYEKITNALSMVAEGANPTGRYIHGREIDASVDFKGAYPLIVTFPFILNEDNEGVWDTSELTMRFLVPDKPYTKPPEMWAMVNAMVTLSKTFTDMLKARKDISIRNIRKNPRYKIYAGTLTGVELTFTIQAIDECPANWQDYLPVDYLGELDYDT